MTLHNTARRAAEPLAEDEVDLHSSDQDQEARRAARPDGFDLSKKELLAEIEHFRWHVLGWHRSRFSYSSEVY